MSTLPPSFAELMEGWGGESVLVRYDAPTNAFIFIAIHDDTLGMAAGGCRMMVYPRPEEGLRDVLRLSKGMTYKWAAMGLPFGGGKSVIALSRQLDTAERTGLLHRFGEALDSLGGRYGTGEDLGTTPEDMAEIATVTSHVVQAHGRPGVPNDPGPFTALGVFEGMKSALRHEWGSDSLEGRSVLIEGVGDVGAPLARLVSAAGAHVLLADLDEDRAFAISVEVNGTVVRPDNVHRTACDVYAPCAVGATLNERTIPKLACSVVAGSANNQLEVDEDAERLHGRGILYAPDYVVNGGGALAFGLISLGETDTDELERRVVGIGAILDEIFDEAADADESPLHAAHRLAERAIERGSVD